MVDKMKIQIITGNKKLKSEKDTYIVDYNNPKALDEFDVNVLDLSYEKLWRYEGSHKLEIDCNKELLSISKMIENSEKTIVIFVYPQNVEYQYDYDEEEGYESVKDIKELVNDCSGFLGILDCFPYGNNGANIIFEPTKTKVGKNEVDADFHFLSEWNASAITKSVKSEKTTTIKYSEKLIFTTLNICASVNLVEEFVKCLIEDNNHADIPQWVLDYSFGTDKKYKKIIEDSESEIKESNRIIEQAKNQLDDNLKYKSILYTNGDDLVKVVFEILEKMMNYDLSGFIDEKKEDFLIEKENAIFIGEIKGVTSNVKNEHISQLEVHYQKYIDDLQDESLESKVRGLLIINPFRTKPLIQREPIHEKQIALAKRNGSIIIETETLLKIFDLYQKGMITSSEIVDKLANFSGLLSIDYFEKRKIN